MNRCARPTSISVVRKPGRWKMSAPSISARRWRRSSDQRAILVMCDLQGLSYAEIAEVLKIPFGTVQSRIFYARKKLKEHLDENIIFGEQ